MTYWLMKLWQRWTWNEKSAKKIANEILIDKKFLLKFSYSCQGFFQCNDKDEKKKLERKAHGNAENGINKLRLPFRYKIPKHLVNFPISMSILVDEKYKNYCSDI